MRNFYTLDIETAATNQAMALHAGLEPWRLRQGNGRITSIAICKPDGSTFQIINDGSNWLDKVKALLGELQGKIVYAHYAVFDIAWLLAQLQPDRCGPIHPLMRGIQWRCSQLLGKWICNGQLAEDTRFSYALSNLARTFLSTDPDTPDFLKMKAMGFNAGTNDQYWIDRGNLDVIMTGKLVEFFLTKILQPQIVGLLTEFQCLVPVANSWIMGIRIDQKILARLQPEMSGQKAEFARRLGVDEGLFTSPKRLGHKLFVEWGLPIQSRTPTGAPGCSKEDLMWLQYNLLKEGSEDYAAKVGIILEAKVIATVMSKYVKTTHEALSHTTDGYIYGAPRIFGTYTGRFTYSNTTKSTDFESDTESKYKTGIALHQMPRKAKNIREMLLPPEGMALYEADASGQESRLMALRSGDETMLKVFSDNMNFHSMTGANIIGADYYEFEEARAAEKDEGYYTEQRQLGKLTNLSCNYRIGGKALSEKAFVNYDTYMTIETGNFLVNTFKRGYPGVPKYWDDVVWESKNQGYADVYGGRRFKLSKWATDRWMTESSAINVPIQGAGASMKEIAIAETYHKNPDCPFALDLHDASFMYVKEDEIKQRAKELDETLDKIDYAKYWGFTPSIPLPYESKFGVNFSQVK
jgi:DNA polymerase I-like protein with 3'-5' exonuclease and polymerase domains